MAPTHVEEPKHYSPSLARASSHKTFWIDARSGCRFSRADREKLRVKLAQRDENGRVVDRFPRWLAYAESRRETKLKVDARALLAEHARNLVEPDKDHIEILRFEIRRIELEMMIATGESGSALAAILRDIPGFDEAVRELVSLTR